MSPYFLMLHTISAFFIWIWSNTMNFYSALWMLMAWCFSTRASVATVPTTHPCVSRCLGAKLTSTRHWHVYDILCSVVLGTGHSNLLAIITTSLTNIRMPDHNQLSHFPAMRKRPRPLILVTAEVQVIHKPCHSCCCDSWISELKFF